MILITGATGTVGGAVLKELIDRGVGPLRAMYRDAKDKASLPGGVEGVEGDFAKPESLDRALAGVDAAYLVCAAIPELIEFETNFLKAASKAGTRHVVIQSALGAADFGKSFPSWHRQVEQAAKSLSVPSTTLRPNGFMQNIVTYSAPTIRTQDTFYDALGKAKINQIDVRDIAAAAARALTSSETIGEAFDLHGPEAIANDDLARRISKAVGRPIRCVDLTLDQMLQSMIGAGMPAARAKPVVELYEYYLSGRGEGSDQALRSLIKREPRRIDAYLAEIAPMLAKA